MGWYFLAMVVNAFALVFFGVAYASGDFVLSTVLAGTVGAMFVVSFEIGCAIGRRDQRRDPGMTRGVWK